MPISCSRRVSWGRMGRTSGPEATARVEGDGGGRRMARFRRVQKALCMLASASA
jgi:hypothetical protein